MPFIYEYQNRFEIFEDQKAKAYLLVFATHNIVNSSGLKIKSILNQFDKDAINEKRDTNIAYPILPEFDKDHILKFWQNYNSGNLVPCFVFTNPQGFSTGTNKLGMPESADELLDLLRLDVQVIEDES